MPGESWEKVKPRLNQLSPVGIPSQTGSKTPSLKEKFGFKLPADRNWLTRGAIYDKNWQFTDNTGYNFRAFGINGDIYGKNLAAKVSGGFTEFELNAKSPWTDASIYVAKTGIDLEGGFSKKKFLGLHGKAAYELIGGKNKIGPINIRGVDFYFTYDLALGLGAKGSAYVTPTKGGKIGGGVYVGGGGSAFIEWRKRERK